MLCLLVNTRFSYLVDIRCKSKNLSAGDHVKQVIHCSQQTLHESFCVPWLAGLVITVQHLNSNDQIYQVILMKSISSSKIIPNHTFHVRILGNCFSGSQASFSCCRMYSSTCQRGRMLAIKESTLLQLSRPETARIAMCWIKIVFTSNKGLQYRNVLQFASA